MSVHFTFASLSSSILALYAFLTSTNHLKQGLMFFLLSCTTYLCALTNGLSLVIRSICPCHLNFFFHSITHFLSHVYSDIRRFLSHSVPINGSTQTLRHLGGFTLTSQERAYARSQLVSFLGKEFFAHGVYTKGELRTFCACVVFFSKTCRT